MKEIVFHKTHVQCAVLYCKQLHDINFDKYNSNFNEVPDGSLLVL